jgi:23S rRNA (uracil1939-C5)-methyltransferase
MSKSIPVSQGQVVRLNLEGITHEGEGVARFQGYTIFVPEALPGDEVEAEVISTRTQYGRALPLSVLRPSPDRVHPRCPYYDRCGGCQLMHADYGAQLHYKSQQVSAALRRIGGFDDLPVLPILGMREPWLYRNKAHLPVGEEDGSLIAGFYRRRSHQLVDVQLCLIQAAANNEALQAARQVAVEFGIPVYDEHSHSGVLRSILLRSSLASGELMVVYVVNSSDLPYAAEMGERLAGLLPHMVSFQFNVNTKKGNTLLGQHTVLVRGKDHILDELLGLSFKVSARSFYQVNPEQTAVLYETARQFAGLTGNESVVDLYCGVGTIGLSLAGQAGSVTGIEIVPEAVEDARQNAQLNNVTNAAFICGAAEVEMPRLVAAGQRFDVAVLDPPRAGCNVTLLDAIIRTSPDRVVYVSCNPATLARDLKYLAERGYAVQKVQPVDMFPHTSHVETVVLMSRA